MRRIFVITLSTSDRTYTMESYCITGTVQQEGSLLVTLPPMARQALGEVACT